MIGPVPNIADDNPEPEIPVYRWPDGVVKPEQFWNEHERGMIALAIARRDEHRANMARMQAEREAEYAARERDNGV